MQEKSSRADRVLISSLALKVGLADWFRFVRLCLPILFVLAIYFFEIQFNLSGVMKAVLVFLGLEIISDAPDFLSKVLRRTEPVLVTGNGFIELKLENEYRVPMNNLVSMQVDTHWWPLKRNTIIFEFPEETQVIRTNLDYGPLSRYLNQMSRELKSAR